MTIVFFSNVLNHHQVALCDELYQQNNGNFYFVETGQLEFERKTMGYEQYERPYLIRILSSDSNKDKASLLAQTADVAIMGAASYPWLKLRLSTNKGVTFSYSERWLKQGLKNIFSPNLLKIIMLYMSKGHKRKWFMLAASGYLANDLSRIGIFKNKVFKWGYFPKYPIIDSTSKNRNFPVKILWVGRLICWKRPDIMIEVADMLQSHHYNFELGIIGDGEMSAGIKASIDKNAYLKKYVKLKGNIAPHEVLKEMAMNDIFCFTSTRREGWGAVLGEAMASGCCPVASADAGATPFLIKNGKNGLIFRTNDAKDLYEKISFLIDNPDSRVKMAEAAQNTMLDEWCAATAAHELISLSKIKLGNGDKSTTKSNLPASPAIV